MSGRVVHLASEVDFDGWRDAARTLLRDRVPADQVIWQVGVAPADLFAATAAPTRSNGGPSGLRVPKAFLQLAQSAILHSDPARFGLLYSLLLRVLQEPRLMGDKTDRLHRRVDRLAGAVGRDIHKMRAFLRFREVGQGDSARYVAWFEPDHHITRANAGFFVGRFATMNWSILTPETSLHWDRTRLHEGPGASMDAAAPGDPVEEVWKSYYSAIFNPARLNRAAMLREMPMKYWKNMPETALIPDLIATARQRELEMIERSRKG